MSQAQAAAAWNVPLKTLQKWEQGLREPQGLALDALRQKLAEATPRDEQPATVPAPEASDATLDVLAQTDPTPPESATAITRPIFCRSPRPRPSLALRTTELGGCLSCPWLIRTRGTKERMKAMPPLAGEVGR